MLEGYYRNLQNAFGLKALTKQAVMPNPNLAIAGDDEMMNVPLLIFRDQHLRIPGPVTEDIISLPYEKTAVKGANDTLSIEDFPTTDFQLGPVTDGF